MKTTWLLLSMFISFSAFASGGIEGGNGGNGINGRPLESYAVDLTNTAEYQQVIAPILQRLKKKLPDLEGYLEGVTANKPWYFVPVALETLPSSLIGVSFPTDQIALQSNDAVWIDSLIYNGMTIGDRAHLLLHEMVMSFILCNGGGSTSPHVDPLSGQCTTSPQLGPTDYDHIRAFVVQLFSLKDSDSPTAIQKAAYADGLGDVYFLTPIPPGFDPSMNSSDFVQFINSQNVTTALPPYINSATSRQTLGEYAGVAHLCTYAVVNNMLSIRLSYDNIPSKLLETDSGESISLKNSPTVTVLPTLIQFKIVESVNVPKAGDKRAVLTVLVDGQSNIQDIKISHEAYLFNVHTFKNDWLPLPNSGIECGPDSE